MASQSQQQQQPFGGSSSTSSHPLRPYYQPAPDASVFVASAPKSSSSSKPSASSSTTPSQPNRSAVVTLPNPKATNRYAANDPNGAEAQQTELGALSDWAKAGAMALLVQYSSTCMAMPFEVGKLLLQVQWVPKDEVWHSFARDAVEETEASKRKRRRMALQQKKAAAAAAGGEATSSQEGDDPFLDDSDEMMAPEAEEWRRESSRLHMADEDEDEDDEDEDDTDFDSPSDVDAYFRDASSSSSRPKAQRLRRSDKAHATDSSGYLIRRSLRKGEDSGPRPEFVMPIVVRGGVWEMMKAVARGKEGWPGLWKGAFTSFLYDTAAGALQPIVSVVISGAIPQSLSPLPLPYVPHPKRTLALLVSTHIVVHLLLSPLDLIRTRLVVQSTLPRHRKYTGPWDALKKILKEEGGWSALYTHPHLLFPSLLDLTIRPLLSLSSPLLMERWLRVEPTSSPVLYAFAELAVNTASLLVSLPIETVRRRLQVQKRPGRGPVAEAPKVAPSTPTKFGSARSSTPSGNTGTLRGLRTCVETRPKPYNGVLEAVYRILTEETSHIPHVVANHLPNKEGKHRHQEPHRHPYPSGVRDETPGPDETPKGAHPMTKSEILAPQRPIYATLGGVKSLYRGFSMAASANLLVFFLTVVTGERTTGGGAMGGVGGGWAEI